MEEILHDVDQWLARGEHVAVATVVGVHRSAPRPPGAKMAFSSSGQMAGAVSGGCVEGAVVEAAQEVLDGGPPRLLHFGIADEEAWDVGLPCGGEIDVWVERYEPGPFADAARAGERAAQVTRLTDGAKLFVHADGATSGALAGGAAPPGEAGPPGGAAAEDPSAAARSAAEELMWLGRSELRGDLFVDVVFPAPRMFVFGAVDFAAALCTAARFAGWRPYVIDPRGFFARPDRFPAAEEVVAAWPDEAVAKLGGIDRATWIAVLTHDPKLDDAALSLALRSEAAYIGAMGSRRANEKRTERLLAAGFTDDDLARIAQPIGLDVGGVTAEETAISIVGEMVAVRHGRRGGRLGEAGAERIHDVG
ncbi:MAG TPA: XdhC/CoxI family protein [Solirubrobacteraceae bacterium]|jgi:xanthine dehydrogenase accessory factor